MERLDKWMTLTERRKGRAESDTLKKDVHCFSVVCGRRPPLVPIQTHFTETIAVFVSRRI